MRLASVLLVLALVGCRPPTPRTASGAPDGPALYARNCEGCHGKDGRRGEPPAQLSHSARKSLREVIQVVSEGRKGMPAWKGKLQPEEIEAVAAYAQELGRQAAGSGQ